MRAHSISAAGRFPGAPPPLATRPWFRRLLLPPRPWALAPPLSLQVALLLQILCGLWATPLSDGLKAEGRKEKAAQPAGGDHLPAARGVLPPLAAGPEHPQNASVPAGRALAVAVVVVACEPCTLSVSCAKAGAVGWGAADRVSQQRPCGR